MTTNAVRQKVCSDAAMFLKEFRPNGPWVLTAITPDVAPVVTETFTDLASAQEFIAESNENGANLYYSVNRTKRALRSKASKADIACIEFLHVDADPADDETPAEFKKCKLAEISRFRDPPTFVVDSGNGLQLLWQLRVPVEVTDKDVIADIEGRNWALADVFGAAPLTRNIDRIFRVPGTINYPNEKKRKLGRTKCEARLLKLNDVAYEIEAFPLRVVPASEDDQSSGDQSGSGHGFRFMKERKLRGDSYETAREAILDDPGEAGEWARRAGDRQLRRAWDNVKVGSAKVGDWHDPDISLLDDRRGDLPKFPLEVLRPEELRDWVEKAAQGTATNIDHVAVPLLGVASSLIGAARRIAASKTFTQPMTCWTATVGFSGTGKSPGWTAIRRPLDEVARNYKADIAELRRDHELHVEEAKAARANWKRAFDDAIEHGQPPPPKPEAADEPGPFIEPKLYVNDTTIEQMAFLLQARQSGMLLIAEELDAFFGNMSRYSGGRDNPFWLMAWDGNSYSVERIGRPSVAVEHLLVGVSGGLQPDKLAECFQGAADGMYARFLLSWPLRAPYRPLADIDPAPEMAAALERLARLPPRPFPRGRIPLSERARAVFEDVRLFEYRKAEDLTGREREWWAKVPAHVLRLAGTLAYLRWAFVGDDEPREILSQYVEAAERVVFDYFWPHARACLRQVGLNPRNADARQALRWIKTRGLVEVGREEIRREALARRLDAEGTQAVLDFLVQAGWLRSKTVPTSGRSKQRWEVNPLLYTSAAGEP